MTLDLAALQAEVAAAEPIALRSTSTGGEVTFSEEQEQAWKALLPSFPVDAKVPVNPVLLPASTRAGDDLDNRAGDLSAALRSRFCVAYGAPESATEPRFTWISGYAEYSKGDDGAKVYSGRILLAVRSTIPGSAKVVKQGYFDQDGNRLKPGLPK